MFSEQFAFATSALVNLVGGGGKTALVQRLIDECSILAPAIYTTTTRIHPPHPRDGLVVLASDNHDYLKLVAESSARAPAGRKWKLVITGSAMAPELLRGVSPGFALTLERNLFSLILNEADGARSMSIKVPREGEPVLMEGAEYLVPVIGLDCFEKPLGPETVFRWEIAQERFSLTAGEPLTTDLATLLLMNPAGVCKGWKPGMRIIPYINKVDEENQDLLAEELARALLGNEYFPVERVVWGSLLTGRAASLSA